MPRRRERVEHVHLELGTDVGPVERELDVGAEEVGLLADVVAAVLEPAAVDGLALVEQPDRVGELELAARAGLDAVQRVEDLRREHVPADHREVRRRRLPSSASRRSSRTRTNSSSTASGSTQPYDGDLVHRHLHQREHRPAVAVVDVEHGAEQLRVVDHDVVAEQHRERLVADVLSRRSTPRARDRAGPSGGCSGCCRGPSSPGPPSAARSCPSAPGSARARSSGRSGPRSRACRGP